MPKYIVNLGTEDGRVLEREYDFPDEKTLRSILSRDGYYIFRIKREGGAWSSFIPALSSRGMAAKGLISFNQELLALTKAGLPIIRSLDTIMERVTDKGFHSVLREVREAVKGGTSLSEAFENYPHIFPTLYIASVRSGEKSGDLVLSLRRYIEYLKKVEAVRKKLVAASIYPIILIVVAVSVILFLLSYVVPTFSAIYIDAGSKLPYATQILITITTFLKSYFFVLLILAAGLIFAGRFYIATEKGRRIIDGLKLRLPLLSEVIIGYAVSKFSRTLSTVLGGGIPLVESLGMTAGVLNNKILEEKARNVMRSVEEGGSLTESVQAEGLMPPIAVKMLGVGEDSGSLEEMLNDIAVYYEDEVDMKLSALTSVIEPILMLTMGLFVALIVVAMYLPVFKLAETAY